jgi:DNA-binding SARP family transcriptional activator
VSLELRLLGELELIVDGAQSALGGLRQRSVLAVLALHRESLVSAEGIAAALWPDEQPQTAIKTVQVYVTRLRRALGPYRLRLASTTAGYRLRLEPDELDLTRFERSVAKGRALASAGDHLAAADAFDSALQMWRGPALADFVYEPFAVSLAGQLEEERLSVTEERLRSLLLAGSDGGLVSAIRAALDEHPLREGLWALLITSLYRAGRQAEALEEMRRVRKLLLDELGLDPGPELRQLEIEILNQDASLLSPSEARVGRRSVPVQGQGAAPTEADAPEATSVASRRVVTIMVAELALLPAAGADVDPEAASRLAIRFKAAAADVVRDHGGTLDTFVGEAVLAVFGVSVAHEDDPLRAARAAVALRDAASTFAEDSEAAAFTTMRVRIGINTGEVLTRADGEASHVSGEPVGVATRMTAAADADEILLGPTTERLLGPTVRLEPGPTIDMKAQRQPIRTSRLVGLSLGDSVRRPTDALLVGRGGELSRLAAIFEEVGAQRSCRLATVMGPAGIGKSRLVREFLGPLRATKLHGRCLPYGRGITYWPIREALYSAAGIQGDEEPESAMVKLSGLARGMEHEGLIGDRIAALIGLSSTGAPQEEMTWALRKLLGHIAHEDGIVVTIDDIQWAEPALLDLLEQVTALMVDAPILLLTMARPELLEIRPTWRSIAQLIELEPLAPTDAESHLNALISELNLRAGVVEQVLEVAAGNPLFIEQFAEMVRERPDAGADVGLPLSVQAVIASRLDQLPTGEQRVTERGAVIGRVFWWGAVAELSPPVERQGVGPALGGLVRRGLLRPEPSAFVADEAFRFHHLLVRDVAYTRMPKSTRANMHEQFAIWLNNKAADRRVEYQEIVAHHQHEAFRLYRAVEDEDGARRAASEAAPLLRAAGERALARHDLAAAIFLFDQSMALPFQGVEARLAPAGDVVWALSQVGRGDEAADLAQRTLAELEAARDSRVYRVVALAERDLASMSEMDMSAARSLVAEVTPIFEREADDEGLARSWNLRALADWSDGLITSAKDAATRALTFATAAGKEHLAKRQAFYGAEVYGHDPVEPTIVSLRRALGTADPMDQLPIYFSLCGLEAMAGRITDARSAFDAWEHLLTEMAYRRIAAGGVEILAFAEMTAGEPGRAEGALRSSIEDLQQMGWNSWAGFQLGLLGQALALQDRADEALDVANRAASITDAGDVQNLAQIHLVRSMATLRMGEPGSAAVEAQSGLELISRTEFAPRIADATLALARAKAAGGSRESAIELAQRARDGYRRKGHVVGERAAVELEGSIRSGS